MPIDETDQRILEMLQKDGRRSYRSIAEETDITSPTVKTRIDKMVEEGVIEGFTVEVNEEELTEKPVIDVFVVMEADPSDLEDVYDAVKQSGARAVYKTADSKVLARFKGPKESFEEQLNNIPEGVGSFKTILITDEETGEQLPL